MWEDQAIAPAFAIPAVCECGMRMRNAEYVAFAAGGNTSVKDPVGDQLAVYALPE